MRNRKVFPAFMSWMLAAAMTIPPRIWSIRKAMPVPPSVPIRTSNIAKKVMPVPPVMITATKIPQKEIVARSIPPETQRAMPVPPPTRTCPVRLSPRP
ncbi:MAG: hypothetical protein ACK55Z_21685, partial [bacterium]